MSDTPIFSLAQAATSWVMDHEQTPYNEDIKSLEDLLLRVWNMALEHANTEHASSKLETTQHIAGQRTAKEKTSGSGARSTSATSEPATSTNTTPARRPEEAGTYYCAACKDEGCSECEDQGFDRNAAHAEALIAHNAPVLPEPGGGSCSACGAVEDDEGSIRHERGCSGKRTETAVPDPNAQSLLERERRQAIEACIKECDIELVFSARNQDVNRLRRRLVALLEKGTDR